MYSRKVASSQVMPDSLLARYSIACDGARLAADDAVELRSDIILRGLADLVASLAHAEHLLAGRGILGSDFTSARDRQKCNENKSSHPVLLF